MRNVLRKTSRRGFTAFEALLASTILALIAGAVAAAISAGQQQTEMARDTVNASLLARSLMDEIERLPYADPQGTTTWGPDWGETSRRLYDNIDDYANYTDGPNNIADLSGTSYPSDFQNFTRTVTMTATDYSPASFGRTVSGVLVTVTVSSNGQSLITLQRFLSQ